MTASRSDGRRLGLSIASSLACDSAGFMASAAAVDRATAAVVRMERRDDSMLSDVSFTLVDEGV